MKQKFVLLMAVLALGMASCSPENPKAHIKPDNSEEKVVQDNTQVFDPTVDILFVVDNSGSMQTHQRNLSTNIYNFTSTFMKSSVLDYNIGVLTTDMDDYAWRNKACCGELVGSIKIVNKKTPNSDLVLSTNLLVGTSGSADEMSFDPVYAALTPPILNTTNAGFYRPGASLVVIFLTDAEDQSKSIDAKGLYKFLVNLKNGNQDKVLAYGVLVPSNDTTRCDRDDGNTKPSKIENFLSMVANNKNNIMNICDPNYGSRLADMAKDIVDKVGNVIYLNLPPHIPSIRVTYGAIDLPRDPETGWSFDIERNAVILGNKINWAAQPPGSRIKVYYDAASLD